MPLIATLQQWHVMRFRVATMRLMQLQERASSDGYFHCVSMARLSNSVSSCCHIGDDVIVGEHPTSLHCS